MEHKNYQSIIESLLFVWGEPLSIKKIASIIDLSLLETRNLVHELMDVYEKQERGIQIIEVKNSIQMTTLNKNHSYIEELILSTKQRGLSQATLEVLVIVAYKQPITKIEISDIRGVNSNKAINNLLDRELIYESGRLDQIGRPKLYSTTDFFLKCFGFKSLKDLPDIKDFHNIEMFEQYNYKFENEDE